MSDHAVDVLDYIAQRRRGDLLPVNGRDGQPVEGRVLALLSDTRRELDEIRARENAVAAIAELQAVTPALRY